MNDTRMVFCLFPPRPPPLAQFVAPWALDRTNSVQYNVPGESISFDNRFPLHISADRGGGLQGAMIPLVLCLRQHIPGAIKMEGPCGPWAHALAKRPTVRYKPQAEPGLTAPSITILRLKTGASNQRLS